MFALITAKGLGISRRRGLQFLKAYTELLTRLQLHTCAMYLCKCSDLEDVSNTTKLETIIHTTCGHCRKLILLSHARTVTGAHALCTICKSAARKCSIRSVKHSVTLHAENSLVIFSSAHYFSNVLFVRVVVTRSATGDMLRC